MLVRNAPLILQYTTNIQENIMNNDAAIKQVIKKTSKTYGVLTFWGTLMLVKMLLAPFGLKKLGFISKSYTRCGY